MWSQRNQIRILTRQSNQENGVTLALNSSEPCQLQVVVAPSSFDFLFVCTVRKMSNILTTKERIGLQLVWEEERWRVPTNRSLIQIITIIMISKAYDLGSLDSPFDVLDADLFWCLFVVIVPLSFLEINAWKFGRRLNPNRFPFALYGVRQLMTSIANIRQLWIQQVLSRDNPPRW